MCIRDSIYPNPIFEEFTIEINIPGQYAISIFDMMGSKVFTSVTSDLETTLNLSHLASGSYILMMTSNMNNYNLHFIKQ